MQALIRSQEQFYRIWTEKEEREEENGAFSTEEEEEGGEADFF